MGADTCRAVTLMCAVAAEDITRQLYANSPWLSRKEPQDLKGEAME